MRVSGAGPWPTRLKLGPGYQSGWGDDMFPLPSTRTHEAKLSIDIGVSGSWDMSRLSMFLLTPNTSQGNGYKFQGAT